MSESKYEIINTGICDLCGTKMKVGKGTETPTMLQCPKCGQYAYEIFGVLCVRTAVFNDHLTTQHTKEGE